MYKDIGRNNQEYKEAKAKAKLRDKNKCRWPDCKKRMAEVHHILRYADCPHLRYELQNLICLCKWHHKFIKGREFDFVNMFMSILGTG